MNVSTDLFLKSTFCSENKYSILSNLNSDESLGSPVQASTPIKSDKTRRKMKTSITIVNVNCQSLSAKKESFNGMVSRVNPDVVISAESWLSNKDSDASVFSGNEYKVIRRDRGKDNDNLGGVFIMARKDLIIDREEELETNCEILWCRLEVYGTKTIHICAYYRPHEGDEDSLQQLEDSLVKLKQKHENVLIGGDFNFPGWDWKNKIIKQGCRYRSLHEKFGEILDDNSLVQLVDEGTRGRNTLDIFATNFVSRVDKTEVIPGISDHCIPRIEVDVRPIRRKQKPRQISLYSKANWREMETKLGDLKKVIEERFHSSTINELWNEFKTARHSLADKYIPSKLAKSKDSLPYLTPEIKKLITKRDRLLRKR